ncbi:MAG: hypothetical protein PF572_05495 [Patescibacteria group bacterium]|jgi:hypothetical protein|nr:hypothetical protein [Patescibacteria group bacterium]
MGDKLKDESIKLKALDSLLNFLLFYERILSRIKNTPRFPVKLRTGSGGHPSREGIIK